MKIEHKQVAEWLRLYRQINITPQAVSQYRRGKTGSDYAKDIDEALVAIAAESLTRHLQNPTPERATA